MSKSLPLPTIQLVFNKKNLKEISNAAIRTAFWIPVAYGGAQILNQVAGNVATEFTKGFLMNLTEDVRPDGERIHETETDPSH